MTKKITVHPTCRDLSKDTMVALLEQAGEWHDAVRLSHSLSQSEAIEYPNAMDAFAEYQRRYWARAECR